MVKHDEIKQQNSKIPQIIPTVPFGIPHIPNLTRNEFVKVEPGKYIGLNNQGSTCYLNSLLQTLFMTPEFRINLLQWKYEKLIHGEEVDCIPYQLQKLFARLQLRIKAIEDTKDLTKSFQWDSGEVFRQQDIQELCRVLFEAIEMSLDLNEENFINAIYEGKISSVVKCEECNNESKRYDKFLDLSLPIRNEFEKIYNSSLEMALKNFVKPEILEKDNQYKCELCGKKVNALKYIQFEKFPNVLFIQVNRFEYDYNSGNRKKINDKVTFPLEINLEEYVKDSGMYDLFSIVVHSGGAMGGHYYAYINSFEDNKWYNFNDSKVTEVNEEDISSLYGGSSYGSATGYVLMYRKRNMNKIKNIDNSLINNELIKAIEIEKQILIEEEKKWKEKLQIMTIKFIYNNIEKSITVKKSDKIETLRKQIISELELECDEKEYRIRLLNPKTSRLLDVYDNYETTIEQNNLSTYKILTLEKCDLNGNFEIYNPDLIFVNIYIWNEKYNLINYSNDDDFNYTTLHIDRNLKMIDLKNKIYELLNIPLDKDIYVTKKVDFSISNFNLFELFKDDEDLTKDLSLSAIYENSKLFVEIKNDKEFYSKFQLLFKNKLNNIFVRFNHPVNKNINIDKICQSDYKWQYEIEVNKKISVGEVKLKIANFLNLNENDFILKRFSHYGSEIKDSDEKIEELSQGNINLYVQYGTPLNKNHIKLIIMLCENEMITFKIYPYKITEITQVIVDSRISIKDLKIILLKELESKNINLDLSCVLIREHLNNKPTKIFMDSDIISNLNFSDNKKIIIQEYKRNISFIKEGIQISLRLWNQAEWKISEPYEIIVEKKLRLKYLANIIKELFNINIENIDVFRIINSYDFYMNDFIRCKFENLLEKSDNTIDSTPFYIQNDGNMLLIVDNSLLYREPSPEEIKIYCRPLELETKNNNTKSSVRYPLSSKIENMVKMMEKRDNIRGNYKEKGVVIKVKKNEKKDQENKNENLQTNVKINEITKNEEKNEEINDDIFEYEYDDEEMISPII